MECPEWLTSDLVQEFIGDLGQLDKFTIESATKPGDNFLSIIYCVKVTLKDSDVERSLIVKTAIPMEDLEAFKVFPKEIACYKYLPVFEELWKTHADEEITFGPKCFYTAEGEPLTVIVMEDLRPTGFKLRDRKLGLNSRETRMVLEKIAKYHACSVKHSEEVVNYTNHVFNN